MLAQQLLSLGFQLAATAGTASFLATQGIRCDSLVDKIADGGQGTAAELITSGQVQLVINTPSGRSARADGQAIRRAALTNKVPCVTTMSAALAAVKGIADTRAHGWSVRSLQELHS